MRIPFWSGHYLNLGWLAIPVLFFAVIGTVNGVNFTDGLDGLGFQCNSDRCSILYCSFHWNEIGIEPITGAVVGGLMGFLLFNVYPARVFMGDTGSLALGGFVAGGLCDADAVIYPDRRSDLSDRSTFRYHSGYLF